MKEKSTPRVSVVMTAYNAEHYIAEAIESVCAQSYTDYEIICVNDGSQDGTGEVARSFGERVLCIEHDTNKGIATGRNTALAAASGEYIAFIDADDIWEPDKLEKQIAFLEANTAYEIVFGMMRQFLSPDLTEEESRTLHCPAEPLQAVVPSASFIKRSVFEKIGLFDEKWRVGEFIDWMSRVQDSGLTYHVLPEILFKRRIHMTNTGVTQRPSRIDYVRIARASLERKRNSNK